MALTSPTWREGPRRHSPAPAENELASGVSDALAEMEQQAGQLGADAVVGVDIDYETVGNNMLMVSASGTAVRLG